MSKNQELADFIWSVADLLRGDYKRSEYGKVILPLTVLRRMDCVLKPTRQAVWHRADRYTGENRDSVLTAVAGLKFYNLSDQSFATIGADPGNVAKNLKDYINGFSSEATEIINRYEFHIQIDRLDAADLLYQVVQKFAGIDLSRQAVDNHNMGYIFEELIRKFADASNETAGEHFTPREVIELMVELLLAPDDDRLNKPGQVIDILDPACGTGGMLSAAEEHIKNLNPRARVNLYGQELNAESYAICRSDMLLKGQTASSIYFGNSFSQDGHEGERFSYMLANPPFGVEWKKIERFVRDEHEDRGYDGRFGAGLPRINDGSFLFLQHMMSKMRPLKKDEAGEQVGGTRLAIVFNGSPLFTGGAGSGESEIRRWIIEHDYLEAIVALPDQLFYNTGISTYFWIVTNRKPADRKGRVILLDVRDQWTKMRRSLGEKRKEITRPQINRICAMYRDALTIVGDQQHPGHGKVKIFENDDFGYQRITVDRPLKLRFEMTEESLVALGSSVAVMKALGDPEKLVTALKPLLGARWPTKVQAWDALRQAMVAEGMLWPSAVPFQKAMRNAVGVTDPEGEIQLIKGEPEPDPDLRDYENVPMRENIDEYFERAPPRPRRLDRRDPEPEDERAGALQARLRDPVHAPLLRLHAAATTVGNRRRAKVAGGRDPGVARGGDGMTTFFRAWIGSAPMHWRHGRLKNLIASATNGVWGDDPHGDETDVNCVRATDFDRVRQRISTDKLPRRQVDSKAAKKHQLNSGDLILEKSGGGDKQPVGAAALFDLPERAVCSNFCSRVVPASEVEPRFLAYAFSTAYSLGATEAAIKQTTGIQNLDSGVLFALPWAYPGEEEQCGIADFLDAETARIDRLVAARERQRTVFEERIFAETSETLVPGSLSAPLGQWPWIWLPRTPKNRPLVRLGYVCRLQNGLTVDGKRDVSGDVVTRPYLRVANVQAGRVALDTVTEVTVPRAIAERSTLRPGDVLMTEGGDIDKLGRGTVWGGELDDCLHQNHIFAIRPDSRWLDGEYLAFMTQSMHGRCYFESTGVKTTNLASTNSNKILGFPIPLPSVEEQRAIVRDLRARTESSAHVMAKLERQLALLTERRQALITAAVTGQLDVTTARGGESR